MPSENLISYVEECLNQGYSTEQIIDVLLAAGWDEEAIKEALLPPPALELPIAPPEVSATHTTSIKKKKAWLRWSGLGLGLFVVLLVSLIAIAEQGYLPAFSRLYRKTALPLLWHGTTGSPELSLLQMAEAASKVQVIHNDNTLTFTVKTSDASKQAKIPDSPFLAALHPNNKVSLASVSSAASTDTGLVTANPLLNPVTTPQFDPAKILPVSISLISQLDYQQNKGAVLDLSLELGDFIDRIPELKTYLPNIAKKSTLKGIFLKPENKAYLKASLIPYLQTDDQNKWLEFTLNAATGNDIDTTIKEAQSIKSEDLQAYQTIIQKTVKDNGIIRKNGQALAEYELNLTQQNLQSLTKLPEVQKCKCISELNQFATSNVRIAAKLWLEPRGARLRYIEITSTYKLDEQNLDFQISSSGSSTYALSKQIVAPAANDLIKSPGDEYLQKVFEMMVGSTAITDITDNNTKRRNTLSQLDYDLETYKINNPDLENPFPNTHGLTERLDNPDGALVAISTGFTTNLPLSDPEPDKYYYGYFSDGKTYKLTCVITDANNVTSIYSLDDTFEMIDSPAD